MLPYSIRCHISCLPARGLSDGCNSLRPRSKRLVTFRFGRADDSARSLHYLASLTRRDLWPRHRPSTTSEFLMKSLLNWLRKSNRPIQHSRKSSRRPEFETLEARIVPVVGYNYFPAPANNATLINGIGVNGIGALRMDSDEHPWHGTAVMLADGQHVLTAAHMVDYLGGPGGNRPGDGQVEGTFSLTWVAGGMTYKVTGLGAGSVTLAPGWNGDAA